MSAQNNPYIEYYSLLLDKTPVLSDFANGLVVTDILAKIKKFPTVVLERVPTTFAHVFSNLKELYKKIQQFWNQQLNKEIECEEIDLVQIAHHQNVKQICKLLDLVLQTFVLSSEKDYFVGKILETSAESQSYFIEIVEKTMKKKAQFSPRKQREQRLYDKIVQLDHQNENLQTVIVDLCKQKQQAEQQIKKNHERVSIKQIKIKKLNQILLEFTNTPIKRRQDSSFDHSESKQDLLQRMKIKMIQMSKQFEREMFNAQQQIDYLGQKSHHMAELENQIEMYKIKIQANNDAIQQYGDLNRKYAEVKLNLIQKQQNLNECSRKLAAKTTKLQKVQQRVIQLELQVERKNTTIQQMNSNKHSAFQEDPFANVSSLSLHRSLSDHCPEVANQQAQFLYESNKKLREELQKAVTTIKQKQTDFDKLKKEFDKREIFEQENKKLLAIIQQLNEQHDQEKSIILGCLHQLRMRTLPDLIPKQKNKKQQLKANLRAQNSKLFVRANNKMQI